MNRLKLVTFCLGLLLAVPAAANSVEEVFCGHASVPVASMADGEKLCRASVRSFSALPAATTLVQQFHRYAVIIRDPANPAAGLELITNNARAASFFEALLSEVGVQGHVVIRP